MVSEPVPGEIRAELIADLRRRLPLEADSRAAAALARAVSELLDKLDAPVSDVVDPVDELAAARRERRGRAAG